MTYTQYCAGKHEVLSANMRPQYQSNATSVVEGSLRAHLFDEFSLANTKTKQARCKSLLGNPQGSKRANMFVNSNALKLYLKHIHICMYIYILMMLMGDHIVIDRFD